MFARFMIIIALFAAACGISFAQAVKPVPPKAVSQPAITFEKHIRPLLVSQCVGCHNRQTMANPLLSGGLALDSLDSILKGVTLTDKPARAVLIPGKPDQSELALRMETTDTSRRMPK